MDNAVRSVRVEALREALKRMVDLYRHPDGALIVEVGASEADDALIAAVAALDAAHFNPEAE